MQKKVFIFTALLSVLGNLLFGQTLVFSPTTIPNGLYGSAYTNQTLTVTGGTAPYTFSITGNSLPPGMSLSTDGIISGTPTAAGAYSFTVTAQDNTPSPGTITGSQNYTLVVNQAALLITANNATMSYGGIFPTLSVSYSGFVNGDDVSSLTVRPSLTSLPATPVSPVGSYTITAFGAVDANYSISYVTGILSITPVPLTIKANDASKAYGAAVPALSATFTGFVNGDNASSLNTQPTITTLATAASNVGNYPITAAGAVDPNYTISYLNGNLTITPGTLTIKANDASKVYGAAVPALSATYTGFVNGDNASSLTTQPTITTSATAASIVGSYPITAVGAVDPNYTISYVNGTLSVTPGVLTIKANDASMTYGGTVPLLSATYTGFVNGDNASSLTTQPTITTLATAASNVGTYPITAAGAVDPNYTISYQAGTITVGKATLTVTADNKSMPLGGPLPALTVSYSGFVNGDNEADLTIKPTATTTATAASPTGSYTITPSGGSSLNYTFIYVNGILAVGKGILTITANPASSIYGAPLVPGGSLTVSYSGFVNGDGPASMTVQPIISNSATTGAPAGSYTLTPSGAVNPNYTIVYINGIYTIKPAALTVTADNKSMPLGGPLPALTVSYTGFVNGDNAANLTTKPTVTTTATAASPAGNYTITPSGGSSPNYIFTYVNGVLAVAKGVLTITANPANSIYGAALVPAGSLTVSYSGFVNGDGPGNMTTLPIVSNSATAGAAAGNYTLTPSGAVNPNYTIVYVNGIYTIKPATLTVTADTKSMPLGGPLPALTVSYSGFVNGDNAANLTIKPTATTTATAASPAGSYTITPSGGSSPNYNFTYVNGLLAVGKGILIITANPSSSIYGAALVPAGSLTVSYNGFVNGDGPGNMAVQPIVSNSATAGAPAGSYTLTPSGAVNSNYTILYVNGTYTIKPAALTVTADNKSMPLGGPLPALTVSYSGFVNGDNVASLTTKPTATTAATAASPAGNYAITPGGGSSSNYVFNYVNGTLAVAKGVLTITANPASSIYGSPLVLASSLTVSYSGFVNGDGPGGMAVQPIVTNTAITGAPAGNYTLTPSGAVNPNYTIVYVSGIYTIKPATLTVTADNMTMPLGGPLPVLTVNYTGFVNGDNASNLATKPTATTTATAASPAGSYPITPSGGSSPNYNFIYVNGTLAVGKAFLTITANPASSIYGAPLVPAGSLTVSYSGFVNGDGPGNMTTLPVVTNSATAGAPAGNYTLTPSGAVNPNYVILYVNGTYTIKQAALTVIAVSQTMTYGGVVPALKVSYSGFVNGDNSSSLTTAPTVTTTATSTSPAGGYPITASGVVDPNYSISYITGTLTINPATLLVTANAQTKVFGATDPTFTYTVSGFLNGDSVGIFSGSLSRTPGEDVGTYPITKGSLSAGNNYTFNYTGNNLTITIGSQKITWVQSLIVGCNDTTQVHLTATASSGLPITYSVLNPIVAKVSGNVLTLLQPGITVVTATQAGDANHTAAAAVSDTVYYQAASLIRQHWTDAIFFDNTDGDYVQWQWYKNFEIVDGATSPYYTETPSLNGKYYVIATNKDSQQVQSCILTITGGAPITGGIKAFPNPANTGALITITSNYSTAALQGALMQIVDITGRVRQQITNVQPSMQITMPSESGIYIINLLLASGQKVSTNVLLE